MKLSFHTIILLCILMPLQVFSQNQQRNKPSYSFVVLPIRSASGLVEVKEHFVDEFVKVLKNRGHNAISTRYLGTALQDSRFGPLEACTTSTCMTKLVRMVGTRFLVHGSLEDDSSTQTNIVELHVIDVPNNKEVAQYKEAFIGEMNSIDELIPGFTDRVLISVSENVTNETIHLAADNADSGKVSKADSSAISSAPQADSVKEQSAINAVKVTELPAETEPVTVSGTAPVAATAAAETQPASNVVAETKQPAESAVSVWTVDDASAPSSQAASTPAQPQQSAQAQQATQDSVSTSQPAVEATNQAPVDTQVQTTAVAPEQEEVKPAVDSTIVPPKNTTEVSLNNDTYQRKPIDKKRMFKTIRFAGFGCLAAAGIINGLILNNSVKESLDKENTLFTTYSKADDAAHAESAYNDYKKQTEKTDNTIAKRTLFYFLGGLGLAGICITVVF